MKNTRFHNLFTILILREFTTILVFLYSIIILLAFYYYNDNFTIENNIDIYNLKKERGREKNCLIKKSQTPSMYYIYIYVSFSHNQCTLYITIYILLYYTFLCSIGLIPFSNTCIFFSFLDY